MPVITYVKISLINMIKNKLKSKFKHKTTFPGKWAHPSAKGIFESSQILYGLFFHSFTSPQHEEGNNVQLDLFSNIKLAII